MPYAKCGRCSWHIIDRGWIEKVKLPLGRYFNTRQKVHVRGTKRKNTQTIHFGKQAWKIFLSLDLFMDTSGILFE